MEEEVYRGRLLQVVLQEAPTARGMKRFEVVRHPGAVVLCPLEGEEVLMVRQVRPAAGGEALLELPAGTLRPGEDPHRAAERECREEIGLLPRRLTELAAFYAAPGYSSELLHLFLAEDLTPQPLPADEDEDLTVVRLPLAEALARAEAGEIRDAKSLAGLFLVARRCPRGTGLGPAARA